MTATTHILIFPGSCCEMANSCENCRLDDYWDADDKEVRIDSLTARHILHEFGRAIVVKRFKWMHEGADGLLDYPF